MRNSVPIVQWESLSRSRSLLRDKVKIQLPNPSILSYTLLRANSKIQKSAPKMLTEKISISNSNSSLPIKVKVSNRAIHCLISLRLHSSSLSIKFNKTSIRRQSKPQKIKPHSTVSRPFLSSIDSYFHLSRWFPHARLLGRLDQRQKWIFPFLELTRWQQWGSRKWQWQTRVREWKTQKRIRRRVSQNGWLGRRWVSGWQTRTWQVQD